MQFKVGDKVKVGDKYKENGIEYIVVETRWDRVVVEETAHPTIKNIEITIGGE